MKYSSVIGRSDMPFQVFIGPRGVGKTYSALKYFAENYNGSGNRFILMRRTGAELRTIMSNGENPFNKINEDNPNLTPIECDYNSTIDFGRFFSNDILIGYGLALTTFAKMRGVDFSDVDWVIIDEAIPEKHVHKIAGEGDALLHAYESINRNRELQGKPALKLFIMGNSIRLNSEILLALGVVGLIADMKVKGRKRYTDRERGIYIELIDNPEYVEAKSMTALYKLSGGTDFSEQALNNNFTDDSFDFVENVKLSEYVPVLMYGFYSVYRHKNDGNFYIARKKSSAKIKMKEYDKDQLYYTFASYYRSAILSRKVKFDDYATKLVFDAVLSKR